MGVLHGSGKVENGKQHKYQGLDQRHEYPKEQDRQRGKESTGKQKQDTQQGFLGHDIAEKPDGQRQDSSQVAYDLNGEHQGNQPRDRSHEVFNIFNPMKLDAKYMSGCENDQSASQGNIDVGGGRHEPWHQTDEI